MVLSAVDAASDVGNVPRWPSGPTAEPGTPSVEGRPVDLRVRRAAGQLGTTADAVERLPFDLSVLNEGGIFINVDTHNFGLLDRRLDWKSLGITLPRGTDLAFRAPRCGLVPDRYRLPLLLPAAQAHAALHRHSYRFRLIETVFETPSYRWTPWRAWPEFERAFAAAQSGLIRALDAYDADFQAIRASVIATFRGWRLTRCAVSPRQASRWTKALPIWSSPE